MLNGWCMAGSGRSFNHLIRAPYNRRLVRTRHCFTLASFGPLVYWNTVSQPLAGGDQMKARWLFLLPVAGIAMSMGYWWSVGSAREQTQTPEWEVFAGQSFSGRSFSGSGRIPFPVRSLKVNTRIAIAFRTDDSYSSDAGGILLVYGPFSIGDLTVVPRRVCSPNPSGGRCRVLPSGNWDSVIRFWRPWAYRPPPVGAGSNDSITSVIGTPPPPATPEPPSHHRLSDAECQTSDLPPRNQAVYKIRRSATTDTCLSFDPRGNPEEVKINNCRTEQKKLFTLIQV